MFDLLVKNGSVVDGSGAEPYGADVGVTDGCIAAVGRSLGAARRTIDADGALVTPGFVDIHTHYDGQATWDSMLTPSCWHGVTTVVMGNCGVGFAPVHPDRREWLIGLMEGVEDIPGAALAAGIKWNWQTVPEYLNFLESTPKMLDLGTQVPHGAVRAYVMGERGAANEPSTPEDIDAMASIVREGIQAGALGFSTSRTLAHTAIDGEPVPGTFAAEAELFGIGEVLKELGTGVFELAPAGALGEDLAAPTKEVEWMSRLSAQIGRPVSFALTQNNSDPGAWRELLDQVAAANSEGARIRPQVHGRTVSLLLGLQTFHAAQFSPTWSEMGLGLLSWTEQAAALADPGLVERIVGDLEQMDDDPIVSTFMNPSHVFPLGDPPNYEPASDQSLEAEAQRLGVSKWNLLIERMLSDDGRELLNSPVLNYSDGNLDAVHEMLKDPSSVFGLGDGGAHAGQTCDASTTTFLLTHWARDRAGAQLTVGEAVHKMTGATAELYGLGDRGRIAEGLVADLNVIDHDALAVHRPELVADLPGDATRLIQRSDGYVHTIKSGEIVLSDGEDQGLRPGQLLRGAR